MERGRVSRRIIRSILIVFVFLAIAEAAMRLAGAVVLRLGEPVRIAGGAEVLCLGDSFTYGVGAPAGLSYPRQLQMRFNSEPGCAARVVNRGVPGMNSSYIRAHFEEELLKFRPRVVLLMAGVNNLWNVTDARAGDEKFSTAEYLDSVLIRLRVYRFFRLAAFNISYRTRHSRFPGQMPDSYEVRKSDQKEGTGLDVELELKEGDSTKKVVYMIDEDFVSREDATRTLLRDIDVMRKVAAKHGARLVVMTYPGLIFLNVDAAKYAKDNRIPLIDNMDYVLGSVPMEELRYYYQVEGAGPVLWNHPNDRGYALVAENVVNRLPEIDPFFDKCAGK